MTNEALWAALADPTRRRVLETLRRGPASVGDIAAGMPVTRPAVSQHLKALAGAGLVRATARGTRRIYAIDPDGLGALRAWLDGFWADALERFRIEAERAVPRSGAARGRRKGGSKR